jgi:glycosyltransferase involved in cell wall biosynthesis
MSDFQLWSFLPNVADYVGTMGESVAVYYCVDEWSKFSYVDGDRTAAAERELCRKVDIVFATARSLAESRRALNPETHLATHGVDYELFSQAIAHETHVPEDLAALPRPVLGFYGTIQDWVDLELIGNLARRHPEWSIALVGRVAVDVSELKQLPNVHFLGRKPHAALPAYCKGFAVGLIPQKVNDLTRHMNPIKLREYLCAGLPVVSTALPEVSYYADRCHIAANYEEFEEAVVTALATDSPEARRRRSESMSGETWQQKVSEITAHVMRVKGKICR